MGKANHMIVFLACQYKVSVTAVLLLPEMHPEQQVALHNI